MSARRKPPPIPQTGAIAWMRDNLFSSPLNVALTVLGLLIAYALIWPLIDWAILKAVFTGKTVEPCRDPEAGACWPAITERMGLLTYGHYPLEERWRPNLVFFVGAGATAWLMLPRTPFKWAVVLFLLAVYPVLAGVLLFGGVFGLTLVPTADWGGLMLTLLIASAGIVLSFPLGVLLALGRQSDLPVIRWVSVAFIEFWRGVPLITVLYLAVILLPLIVPGGQTIDQLIRALAGFVIFSAAYMAEVVRGGLQAVPKGQYEAASALALGYWSSMGLVILPQALRLSIPSLVNTFCGLIKDTTLVTLIGLVDLLGQIQKIGQDAEWSSHATSGTGYLFAGVIFWALCFSLSRYARYWENRLKQAQGR